MCESECVCVRVSVCVRESVCVCVVTPRDAFRETHIRVLTQD